jgi:GT2 family glycosyltransferase
MDRLCVIIPTYGKFDYAAKAVTSAIESAFAVEAHVFLVDDASPDFHEKDATGEHVPNSIIRSLAERYPRRLRLIVNRENVGLTKTWNTGILAAIKNSTFSYICVTNSDVVFPKSYDIGMTSALKSNRLDLVGPVTNAPGTEENQYIKLYSDNYRGPDITAIDVVQNELLAKHSTKVKDMTLNGFCMMAKTSTWANNMYTTDQPFRDSNPFNSKGQPNPTPAMTLQEYELQARWHKLGLKSGVALSSYVFHYRSVTRGPRYNKGDWTRQ